MESIVIRDSIRGLMSKDSFVETQRTILMLHDHGVKPKMIATLTGWELGPVEYTLRAYHLEGDDVVYASAARRAHITVPVREKQP